MVVPLKLLAFGGMLPALDSRLLPPNAAENAVNVWLYSGRLQGVPVPRELHTLVSPNARCAYRVPQARTAIGFVSDSYWLEFDVRETRVEKSPVRALSDDMYYWADGVNRPGYTALSRIAAGSPALVLGIPTPATAPTIVVAGGVSATTENRSYVYTWVSSFGEEGPPSPPSSVTNGKIDDTWEVTLTAPTLADTTSRVLTHANIYRTITNAQGLTVYRFVAQVAIATLVYNDTLASDVIAASNPLESTNWSAPPEDLEGLVSMPNGMLAGWRDKELWFCEPYRPHAWPAIYAINVDFDIVGMAALDTMLVIGTQSHPYICTGTHPTNMVLRQMAAAEPCTSAASFVVTPGGILYTSPNGLILVNQAGLLNLTRGYITKDRWADLLNLPLVRAGLLNGAYFVFSGVQDGAFQQDAFQEDAFQLEDLTGTEKGALIELSGEPFRYVKLEADDATHNVMQDPWTGELFMIRDGKVLFLDLTRDLPETYTWRSKLFQLAKPENLGAVKVTWSLPEGVAADDAFATMRTYADGVLRQSKTLPSSGAVFRLPSGFKAQTYQFEIEGNLVVHQIEVAATVKELQVV